MVDHYKALAHDARREILELLSKNSLRTGEIRNHIELSAPAVSNHLNILVYSGLISRKEYKRLRIYSINKNELKKVISFLDGLISEKF